MARTPNTPPKEATQVSSVPRRSMGKIPSFDRDRTTETPSQTAARDIAQRRAIVHENARILHGNFRNGHWFDAAGRHIGTAKTERSQIKFSRPRKLGQKGQS